LKCAFPIDVLMDPTSALTFSADGEHLTCGGFYLGETVCLGSFEFIADYFARLSLSLRTSDSGTTFMVPTRNGPPSLRQTLIEDSTEEFHTPSSGGRGYDLPSPWRPGVGAPPAPITTPPWQEDTSAIQSMTTVQSWVLAP
jgi:hypothetical protein